MTACAPACSPSCTNPPSNSSCCWPGYTRWPATANPHLLINRSTGGGTGPVSRSYIQAAVRKAGITAQRLRADRLLGQAQASGGDPLQLTNLFGISDPTAIRYCAEISILAQAGQ